jgi:hypothetical protein
MHMQFINHTLEMEGLLALLLQQLLLDLYELQIVFLVLVTNDFQDLARYLDDIVPPVLACFTDQDARVRYYACESMYNIAKVAKGEVLPYFNDIFDALCKVCVLSELLCAYLFL